VLKNDKNEVFKAASEASKMCDYLHSLENGKVESRGDPSGGAFRACQQEIQARKRVGFRLNSKVGRFALG